MLQIDCKNCKGHCCTSKTRAVLAPKEVAKFKDFATKISTKEGNVYVLKQNEDGHCIFYDPIMNGCKTYETRPFECRMYPYIVYFDGQIDFKLDRRFCPNIDHCTLQKAEEEQDKWHSQKLPLKWIKAYTELDNIL